LDLEKTMGNEARRLLGLVLMVVLLATGQGCGSAAMDGELGIEVADPTVEGPNPDADTEPNQGKDEEKVLAPVTDLQPELIMLSGFRAHHIWGTAEDDMFLAGDAGLLAHFDGARWRPFELDSSFSYQEFTSIIGFSSTDVYAGSGYGNVLHYDGEGWTHVNPIRSGGLQSVFAVGPREVYMAGQQGVFRFTIPSP
jgi:hypothetical protein